uniref:Ankyrin repeat domain-containing protein 11 n=2 Tax=Aceria tosichella TaxID=561515 RepID=A0A6G1SDE9_9ACAR
MANDATGKSTSNSDSLENSLSNAGDQQKVPPLRIVLNSSGNQKSSSANGNHQQSSTKRAQDAKQESTLKTGGRVRIKLGANRQQSGKVATNNETNETSTKTEGHKSKEKASDKQLENINEDSTSSYTHLRRITRRSHRTVQSINNEDEESISSMTSIDENLNTTNSIQPNSDTAHDSDLATTASGATTVNNANNGSSNTDTPRRYKRKKVESSESQSLECDTLLGTQNYKLPNQNSFELFKNIRKQVDKKLKSLTCVHPMTPYGFRDYMLSRGAYLLDGNKLGNGTSLFVNEHGGLDPVPAGKYHLIRHNKMNYSVPNRATAPLGLPVNSPLYDLFIEQEKERYRMRIQHIKEREKLTLAAEQEFMRVYNQAALAAVNQTETFSVCTMLKHQEMYNYLDLDGTTILSREDAQQNQVDQPDGVRTRRRQHGQISPAPTRKSSSTEESGVTQDTAKKDSDNPTPSADEKKSDTSKATDSIGKENRIEQDGDTEQNREPDTGPPSTTEKTKKRADDNPTNSQSENISAPNRLDSDTPSNPKTSEDSSSKKERSETDEKAEVKTDCSPPESRTDGLIEKPESGSPQVQQDPAELHKSNERLKNSTSDEADGTETALDSGNKSLENVAKVTDEEKRTINKEKFLIHLQEIDDKWDKIRHEMLIRHKNEAESLHAIQKLEWEWKTKEIGACDVRTTLLIDNSLVPKIDIFSQDY